MNIRTGALALILSIPGVPVLADESGAGGHVIRAEDVLRQFGGAQGIVKYFNSNSRTSSGAAAAFTFTVISPGDNSDYLAGDGLCGKFQISPPIFVPCSFRAAIEEANAHAGPDIINFDIGAGGVQTISPATPLPTITEQVIIDGTTQPGFAGTPIIELNGTGAGTFAHGLIITAGNSTVQGLVINRFDGYGIFVQSNNNVIQGNFIGTDVGGTLDLGNTLGVRILNSSSNTIGGMAAGDRNVISGNTNAGVNISLGSANRVLGNFIGTDVTGTADLGSMGMGVRIDNSAINDIFNNVISGNDVSGILIAGPGAVRNEMLGNFIGTDAGGSAAVGNGYGIDIISSSNNVVGGYSDEYTNTIAFNTWDGVRVYGGGSPATGNFFVQSSIHSNGWMGINLWPGSSDGVTANDSMDADSGSNHLQNFPVLTSAVGGSSITIQGTLNSTANGDFRLEFFANDSCDSSGHGEGQTYLGSDTVVTDGSGNANITVTFPIAISAGKFITATATDSAGNTSEFCQCRTTCAAAKGDMNASGGLSSADAVLMLNCVYLASGNCDLCFADVNCSGDLTSADAVLELNMVFLGAAPGC